jgi:hypothetical protein
MRRAASALAALVILLGAVTVEAQPPGGGHGGHGGFGGPGEGAGFGEGGGQRSFFGPLANPSAVVSAMLDLKSNARTAGQWTAMRKAAEKDAILFAPGAVNAQRWLKGQSDPDKPLSWDVRQVFMSCGGDAGVARGVWKDAAGKNGAFSMVWREREKGGLGWLIYHSGPMAKDLQAQRGEDGEIDGTIADCAARSPMHHPGGPKGKGHAKPKPALISDPPPASGSGQSGDGTLRWSWDVAQDGGRHFTVTMRKDGTDRTIIDDHSAAGDI